MWEWLSDCVLEICDVDNGYEEGEQIILYLEHNCSQHDPECTWDSRQNTVAIFTQSQNSSHDTVESTLNISKMMQWKEFAHCFAPWLMTRQFLP